jgi:Zn-dependent peptidase ImmA (M78 family)
VVDRYVELPEPAVPAWPVPPADLAAAGPGAAAGPDTGDRPAAAARRTRAALDVPAGPVRHVVRLLETHGVLVLVLPVLPADLDAFSVGTFPRPLVLLNPSKNDYFRRRFDAAHELGHLVMHADAEPGDRLVEDQANRFAAEFLLPEAEVADLLPRRVRWAELTALKERWGVSLAALLYRARTLRILDETAYRNATSTMSKRGWRRLEPGPHPPPEQPTLLTRALELLAADGIDRDRVADAARVTRADLDHLVPHRPGLAAAGLAGSGVRAEQPG